MSVPSSLVYPGLKWLEVSHDSFTGMVHVKVRYNGYSSTFSMAEGTLSERGEALIKEAYFRRAQLMAVEKIAKELEDDYHPLS